MKPRQLSGAASCVACACMCLLQRRRFETALYYTERILGDHLAFFDQWSLAMDINGGHNMRIQWIAKGVVDESLMSGLMCTRCCGMQHGSSRRSQAEMLGALPQFLLYRFFDFLACKYPIALAMVCPSIIPHHPSVTTCLTDECLRLLWGIRPPKNIVANKTWISILLLPHKNQGDDFRTTLEPCW